MFEDIRIDYRMSLDCFIESELLKIRKKRDLSTKSGKALLKLITAILIIILTVQAVFAVRLFKMDTDLRDCLVWDGIITLPLLFLTPFISKAFIIYQKRTIFKRRRLENAPCYIVMTGDGLIYSIDGAEIRLCFDDVFLVRETEKCFTVLLKNGNESISVPKHGLTRQIKQDFSSALGRTFKAKFQNLCSNETGVIY